MNGTPLTARHGHPVRAVIPGISGSKWVKWLDRITVQDHESPNFYQRHDYRVLPPEVTDKDTAEKFWPISPPLYDIPVNSAIAVPESGETIHLSDPGSGLVEVKGYALPHGADGPVTRVEVSGDGGKTWVDATLEEPGASMKWCWVLWKASIHLPMGKGREIVSRAMDRGYNRQKEHSEWNLRGVGYNGYGRASDLTVVSSTHL